MLSTPLSHLVIRSDGGIEVISLRPAELAEAERAELETLLTPEALADLDAIEREATERFLDPDA